MKGKKGYDTGGGSRAANMLGGKDGLSEDNAVMRRLRARAAERAAADKGTRRVAAPAMPGKPQPKATKGSESGAGARREMAAAQTRPLRAAAGTSGPDVVTVTARRPTQRIASGGTATPRFGNTKPNYGTSTRGPAEPKPGPEARAPRPGLLDRIVNNDRALRASNRAAQTAAEKRGKG